MDEVAAPQTGTPAAPAPGAAPNTPPEFIAPWSTVEGVYTIGEGEGEQAKPWWEGIKEEPIRNYMKEKNYANPYEAAAAAWNSNKLNKLTPDVEAFVNNKATPEQEANVFKLLGRPESAEGYDFKVPEGVEVDERMTKFGKELFFKMGLSPARAQAGFDAWNEFAGKLQAEEVATQQAANDAALAALSTKWGPELEANRVAGHRAVQALGLDTALVEKIEAKIGSAEIVELLAAIGKKSAEGGFKGGGSNVDPNDPSTMTKEQAAAKIKELQADGDFQKKYNDKNHEGHKDALLLMEKLFVKAG